MTPAHTHDCDECVFVGGDVARAGEPPTNQVDMYVHRSHDGDPGRDTLIRRYGSEGANYGSMDAETVRRLRLSRYLPVLNTCS